MKLHPLFITHVVKFFGAIRCAHWHPTRYDTLAIDALTMPEYRRNFVPGGTYFFTVNQLKRHDNINPLKHSLVRRVAEWAGDRLAERLGYAD